MDLDQHVAISVEDEAIWESRNKRLQALMKPKQKSVDKLLDPALYEAASTGDADRFIDVLEKFSAEKNLSLSEIIEQETPSGDSLLHAAASSGNGDIAKHIACLFPSLISKRNSINDTALHIAARDGVLDTVKSLVQYYVSPAEIDNGDDQLPRMKNAHENTALHEAVRNNVIDVVRFLISEDPDVRFLANVEGWSPLYMAVKRGHLDILSLLLQEYPAGHGDSLQSKLQGNSPAHAATTSKRSDMLEEMAKKDAGYLRLRDAKGRTPLHLAAFLGKLHVVSTLLSHARETNFERDERGFLPIHIAAERGHIGIIEELLKCWPEPLHLLTQQGQNILHVAAMRGKDNVVKYMLSTPSKEKLLNAKDKDGNTALHLAAIYSHPGVVLTLTWAKGIDKNPLNNESLTPLDTHFKSVGDSIFTEHPKLQQILTLDALSLAGCGNSSDPEIKSKPVKKRKGVRKIEWLKDNVGTLLTVATLVATGTFAAGFTAPGGNTEKGSATLLNQYTFQIFMLCNSAAFYMSLASILCCFYTMYDDVCFAPRAYGVAKKLFGISVFLMSLAFTAAVQISVSKLSWLDYSTLIFGISCALFLLKDFPAIFVPLHRNLPVLRYLSYFFLRAAIYVYLKDYDLYAGDELHPENDKKKDEEINKD